MCVTQQQSCVEAHTFHASQQSPSLCLVLKEQTLLGECRSCVYAIQVFGGDKAKLRKTDNLKNEVAGLEAAVQAASQEYDRVKLRNTQVWLHTNPCACDKSTPSSSCGLFSGRCTCFFAAGKVLLIHLPGVHNHHTFTRISFATGSVTMERVQDTRF